MTLLEVQSLTRSFGGVHALRGVDLTVRAGRITGLIGPNGAGKSTLFNAICGSFLTDSGRITLDGNNITFLPAHQRAKDIGCLFQDPMRGTAPGMTVEENLEMGAFIRDDDKIRDTMEQIYGLFPILKQKRYQKAGELSGGQRQQVAVGRALMTQPKVLMLDEPTAGVSPIVMDELFDRIIEIARTGISILMVEQNARQALGVADRAYILETGRVVLAGPATELAAGEDVQRAYLGGPSRASGSPGG